MITIIAAVAKNRAIGYQNKLIYWLPNDLKRFKKLTTGHTIIMGRNTFLSLPKGALPNRRNIVLSRSQTSFPGCDTYPSLEEALGHCAHDEDIYIIGGASVYQQALPLADRLCLTEIDDTPDKADTFFPDYDDWQEDCRENHLPDERHDYPYAFVDYVRKDKITTKYTKMKKTVLITGATSGIGLGCANKFAQNGDRLILTGRNSDKLETLKHELTAKGTDVITLTFDVRDREAARKAIENLPEGWQDIDVLINNAGLALGLDPEYEGDLDDWETMIDTNVKGLLTMTRLIVPQMVVRNSGHIINIGSVAGDAAYAGGNVYCATKAAVKALSDGLRIDVANTAVRVTNLKPGLVETNFSNIRFHGDTERAATVYQGIKPLTGDDIADVAVYAANAPAHVQIAEVLILATHQASGSVIVRK